MQHSGHKPALEHGYIDFYFCTYHYYSSINFIVIIIIILIKNLISVDYLFLQPFVIAMKHFTCLDRSKNKDKKMKK